MASVPARALESSSPGALRRRRAPAAALAAAAALLLAGATPAQFVNRATWLGVEEEGLRRNFRQGTEYFLDRLSYVELPPWWERGLPRFHDQFRYRVGSTSATQFTVEGNLDVARELGDGFTFRYHFLQGENRDTRFTRSAFGLDYELSASTALFVQAEPFAEKSLIDLSAGAWLWRDRDRALRVMVTAVDHVNDKSRDVDYLRDPYALLVSGAIGPRDGHRVVFEVGAQAPFTVVDLATAERLELWRAIADVDAHLRLGERDRLVLAVEAEATAKEQRAAAGGALREDFEREFAQVRAEWWRDGELPWSLGVAHTALDERGRRPGEPAAELRTHRRDWLAIARLHWPVGERLSFEPQLFAGRVRDAFRDAVDERDEDRFEGRLNWTARWRFRPGIDLALTVGCQLDELAFAGGGAMFVAEF